MRSISSVSNSSLQDYLLHLEYQDFLEQVAYHNNNKTLDDKTCHRLVNQYISAAPDILLIDMLQLIDEEYPHFVVYTPPEIFLNAFIVKYLTDTTFIELFNEYIDKAKKDMPEKFEKILKLIDSQYPILAPLLPSTKTIVHTTKAEAKVEKKPEAKTEEKKESKEEVKKEPVEEKPKKSSTDILKGLGSSASSEKYDDLVSIEEKELIRRTLLESLVTPPSSSSSSSSSKEEEHRMPLEIFTLCRDIQLNIGRNNYDAIPDSQESIGKVFNSITTDKEKIMMLGVCRKQLDSVKTELKNLGWDVGEYCASQFMSLLADEKKDYATTIKIISLFQEHVATPEESQELDIVKQAIENDPQSKVALAAHSGVKKAYLKKTMNECFAEMDKDAVRSPAKKM